MKALTLWQPWATLIAIGAKKIETRSWATPYRGPLAIHASKSLTQAQVFFLDRPFYEELTAAGFEHSNQLPLGAIVATCELVDIITIEEGTPLPAGREIFFGDYQIGRKMWMLRNVVALDPPVPARGGQGLWEWNP